MAKNRFSSSAPSPAVSVCVGFTPVTEKKATSNEFPPGVAQPAIRVLKSVGITRLEQCAKVTEAKLAMLHGMGPNALGLIREALKAKGQTFADGSG